MKECFSNNIMQLCPISIHTRMIAECYYTFHVNVLICYFLLCYSLNYYLNTICYHKSHSYVQRFRTPYDYIIICKGPLILSSSFQDFAQKGANTLWKFEEGANPRGTTPYQIQGKPIARRRGKNQFQGSAKAPSPLEIKCVTIIPCSNNFWLGGQLNN